uniref:Uncharacterized protein n=1 Tax=Zooxanthella nutricula TaxID=1333877 RepID=A0A7S2P3Q4_9DINO
MGAAKSGGVPATDHALLAVYPGWGMDGERMHSREYGVPPERWCVTKQDLRFLRSEIEKAIEDRRIAPTDCDPFDPCDRKTGPCMYNVVQSYMKPLTAHAGGMSWALMRHPNGLDCDMFLTHCWAEGAFELIDKVIWSWPMSTKGAWCCILANPQNLDISDLINDPGSSPFAKALCASSCLMVVPTRATSNYSRIWCIYEAFLAVELGKTVLTASSPIMHRLAYSVLIGLGISVPSFASGYWFSVNASLSLRESMPVVLFNFFPLTLACCSIWVTRHPRVSAVINCIGTSASMILVGGSVYRAVGGWGYLPVLRMTVPSCYFFCNEVDRLCSLRQDKEAGQLDSGYAGVHGAAASVEADRKRILDEIGHRDVKVDHSIRVLIESGMSTRCLRRAAKLGVDLRHAGELRWGFVMLSAWLVSQLLEAVSDVSNWPLTVLLPFVLVLALIWVLSQHDHKAFMATMLIKITLLVVLISLPAQLCTPFQDTAMLNALRHGDNKTKTDIIEELAKEAEELSMLVSHSLEAGFSILLLFSLVGRGWLAELPCIGPWLVQALGPGCACCRCRVCWRAHNSHDQDSGSECSLSDNASDASEANGSRSGNRTHGE